MAKLNRRGLLGAAVGVTSGVGIARLATAQDIPDEDPGWFGTVVEHRDGETFLLALHGSDERVVVDTTGALKTPATDSRDGWSSATDLPVGERFCVLGDRDGDGTIRARDVKLVYDLVEPRLQARSAGALETSAGPVRVDERRLSAPSRWMPEGVTGRRPADLPAGARLWLVARKNHLTGAMAARVIGTRDDG